MNNYKKSKAIYNFLSKHYIYLTNKNDNFEISDSEYLKSIVISLLMTIIVPILTCLYLLFLVPYYITYYITKYYSNKYDENLRNKIIRNLVDYFDNELKNNGPLEFKYSDEKSHRISFGNVYNLIEYLFYFNNKCNTYYKNGSIQCDSKRRRSLGDIYCIAKEYFPNTTPLEILYIFIYLSEHNSNLKFSYCHTVEKLVFHTTRDSGRVFESKVEYFNFSNDIELKKLKYNDIINSIKTSKSYKDFVNYNKLKFLYFNIIS